MSMAEPLLKIEGLSVAFGDVAVVDALDLAIAPGESLGVVGESGSGKSMTALAVMGLLPEGARITGTICFDGQVLDDARREALRGTRIAMVFQEPMTSLNPVLTVGEQIAETLRYHQQLDRRRARARAVELLGLVEIPDAARRLDAYPHQLSGGQRQRVMIAIALACNPSLLIADEPTTALDVTVQAQLLDLLNDLRRETGMAMLLITHNMGVIAEFADRVVVMYSGRVAEEAPVETLFDAPRHPYTQGLLGATPTLAQTESRLRTIPGALPDPASPPPGCRFAPRCSFADAECSSARPAEIALAAGHRTACRRTDATMNWQVA